MGTKGNTDIVELTQQFVQSANLAARRIETLTEELKEEKRVSSMLGQNVQQLLSNLRGTQEALVACQAQVIKMRQLELSELQLHEMLSTAEAALNNKSKDLENSHQEYLLLQKENNFLSQRVTELTLQVEKRSINIMPTLAQRFL